jgi:hypothetical protein
MSTIIRILCIVLPFNAILALYLAGTLIYAGDYIGATIALIACPVSLFLWTLFRMIDREYRATN